jgi:hypothetical protein
MPLYYVIFKLKSYAWTDPENHSDKGSLSREKGQIFENKIRYLNLAKIVYKSH